MSVPMKKKTTPVAATVTKGKTVPPKATPGGTKVKTAPKDSVKKQVQAPVPSAGTRPSNTNEVARLPARLQAVIDKSEIAEALHTFARGVDRIDETILRSLFHADATVDLGPGIFQGTAGDYVQWVLGVQQEVRASHTMIGSVRSEIEGDAAFVESYFQIHHRIEKPTGREDLFIAGRFLDLMERRPAGTSGIWKIEHHKQIIDWTRTEAVSEIFYHQNPDALWGVRGRGDAAYFMRHFPGSHSGGRLPSFLGRRYSPKSVKL